MRVEYDPAADVLYIKLRDSAITESDEVEEGFIFHYDRDKNVIAIEILDVRKKKLDVDSFSWERIKEKPIPISDLKIKSL